MTFYFSTQAKERLQLKPLLLVAALTVMLSASNMAFAADEGGHSNEELAKKLSNPIASLISVPFQFNYDENYNQDDAGNKLFVNIQLVIPVKLGYDWNMISRTILPVAWQENIPSKSADTDFGLGDITQSLFFSPSEVKNGLTWGVGPVFLIPTATEKTLGAEKWGAGPSAIVLKQHGPWTYGALANHVWDFAGKDDRSHVNSTFMQPFLAYTTPKAITYSAQIEATYDWVEDDLALPLNAAVSKLVTIGGQRVQFQGGVRYWADSTANGPEGFGGRFTVTFLFPE